MLILGSFFPISALVYMLFQRRKHLQKLIDDFNLLGISNDNLDQNVKKTEADREGEEDNKKSNTWQFLMNFSNFFVHSFLTAIFAVLGASLLYIDHGTWKNLPLNINMGMTMGGTPESFSIIPFLRYGFLGAYIFSIQLVYRRYTTLDLQPTVYMNCTLTLISGFAFNYTAFNAIANLSSANGPGGIGAGIFAIIAFSLGYFPLLAIRWFNRIANAAIGNKLHRNDALPLSIVDGISQLHETRLRDEGIDNVQNLAAVKIDELLMNTRFNAQQVIEWIDQAILYLYVDKGRIDSFRHCGVRTISDFKRMWDPYYVDPKLLIKNNKINKMDEELHETRQNRALQVQSTPEYLDSLYASTLIGPNIAYIENFWGNLKKQIQARQEQNLKNEFHNMKSVVDNAIIDILENISKFEYFEGEYRENVGKIAVMLDPNFEVINFDFDDLENNSRALAGYAWFADWLTKDKIDIIGESKKEYFTTVAIEYYDKAFNKLSKNPKLIYELSRFFVDNGDIKKAKEYATEATRNGQDNDFINSLFTMVSAWVHYKDDSKEKGDGLITKAVEKIGNSNGINRNDLKYLKRTVKNMIKTFDDDDFPVVLLDLCKTIEKQVYQGSDSGINSPAPETIAVRA